MRPQTLLVALLSSAAAAAMMPVSIARAADGPDCGWQHHFNQLNGNPAQNCLSRFDRRVFADETISAIVTSRTQARPDANMPAVCMNPIPCDWRNARRESSLEHYQEWKVSVTGSASGSTKVSLGEALLRVLSLEVSLTVTVSGTVEYSVRNTWGDLLIMEQQDCHNQVWKFWKTTAKVSGTVTETEEYVWTLSDAWFDGENWHPCPAGPVVTRCTGNSASGTARRETAIELESIITPCCTPLYADPPCCGRLCPR